jgi:hypothetical protein
LEGTGQLGHPDMEYNIKIHIPEMRCKDMYCIYLAKRREQRQELVNPAGKTGWQILTRKAIDVLRRIVLDIKWNNVFHRQNIFKINEATFTYRAEETEVDGMKKLQFQT